MSLVQNRAWLPVVTLVLLAPVASELLASSTPPLDILQPATFLLLTGLYGCGAVLIREIVRQRGLGWNRLLWLAAAYGVIEEGLVTTTWFNPLPRFALKVGQAGRVLGIDLWPAVFFTMFHVALSIATPIIVVEALYPRRATQPWLSTTGRVVLSLWFLLACLLLFIHKTLQEYRTQGYSHPPASYVIPLILVPVLVFIALRHRSAQPAITGSSGTLPERSVLVIFSLLLASVAWFCWLALPTWLPFSPARIPFLLAIALLAILPVQHWSRHAGWGAQERLALVTGPLLMLALVWAPLYEFVFEPHQFVSRGMTLVGFAYLLVLLIAWRRQTHNRTEYTTATFKSYQT